jgi:anti-sigma factor RsiW
MGCEAWTEKLDAYFDGELPTDEARALQQHLRGCPICAAQGLAKVQQKLAVKGAGQRFAPDPAFRARLEKSIGARRPSLSLSSTQRRRGWLPVFEIATIAALALIGVALFLTLHRGGWRDENQLMSELVDQHVATLASANPVDVVSTDRHTVKPWFEGKIPFTFNLPELQGSDFVLAGGRVGYLRQSPGAELIYRIRQHQISVFIFQDRIFRDQRLEDVRGSESERTTLSFEVRSWSHNGLRYFVIGDVGPQDLDKLSALLKAAG